ncbi:JNK-interacting protein 1 [Macrosteles quadrilineatus]|uniref:JNK-interacting protein 1 n=1 Tax=Macrosteles quadrilineatus TaxID=74068 RepID=UPI0023E31FE8|nr:JNK-interacting protein 1 [Macrosteles quadrilineatus]
MADSEFEEFRNCFEPLPQHLKAPAQTYTLVHDVMVEEESPSPQTSPGEAVAEPLGVDLRPVKPASEDDYSTSEVSRPQFVPDSGHVPETRLAWPERPSGERKRRKLPEIPKNKKSSVLSLAEELGDALSLQISVNPPRSLLLLKCHGYLRDADSPDSDRFQSTDVDSGHSTAHSPDGLKSTSPQPTIAPTDSDTPGSPSSSAGLPFTHTQLELLEPTHRGLHKFIPRHRDEMEVEIGDPIYVQKEADDLWCEGVNLRTGQQGIFPSAYAVDMELNDFEEAPRVKRERFLLGYLGSVETLNHKGNSVLCQAVKKIVSTKHKAHSCILEVSDQGLRMVDKSKKSSNAPCHDYFYSLKNVSFCAFHPTDHRYLGFITKHPQLHRFACHVFLGCESTRPVAESIGRAFERFYTKFIETAYPIEDIYIE